MMGGDVLTISGPCFEPTSDFYCRINNGTKIKATYDFARDPFTVRCPVPILLKLGHVDVELSKDGGQTFNSKGVIIVGMYIAT